MSEFKVLNNVFHYEENEDRYTVLRNDQEKMKEEVVDTYIKRFEQLGKLDRVMETYEQDAYALSKNVGKHLYSKLADYEIYNITEEKYLANYAGNIESAQKAVEPIMDKYLDITLDAEERDAYRTARRQNRGRVQGGGFGLEGAAKGMVVAGSINAATNVVHGTFNMIGKGIQTLEVSHKLSTIYKDSSTLNALLDGLCRVVNDTYWEFISYVCQAKQDNKYIYAVGNYDEAEGYFTNAKKVADEEKRKALLVEALKAYRFDEEIYQYIIDQYGDRDGQVTLMAQHCVENWDVVGYKKEIVKKKFVAIEFTNEDKLRAAREPFIDFCAQYGVDAEKYVTSIDELLTLHDEYARTSDDIVYETRDEAAKAEAERHKFFELTNGIDGNNEALLFEIKNNIEENFVMASKPKYIAYLDEQLLNYDKRYKQVRNEIYATREEADDVRAALRKIHSYLVPEIGYDLSAITHAMAQINEEITLDIKAAYIEKLKANKEILNAINEFLSRVATQDLGAREVSTTALLEGMQLRAKCEQLGVKSEQLVEWITVTEKAYRQVKNTNYLSLAEAVKQYYNLATNAATYERNVINKDTSKKSFFGKIASSIKGGVSQIYSGDYEYITENGTRPIVSDIEGERRRVLLMIEESEKERKCIETSPSPYAELETPFEITECILNTKKVTARKPVVDEKLVKKTTSVAMRSNTDGESKVTEEAVDHQEIDNGERYSVQLVNAGEEAIKVIKVIREVNGMGLNEAKALYQNTPSMIISDITYDEAARIQAEFEKVGAITELVQL